MDRQLKTDHTVCACPSQVHVATATLSFASCGDKSTRCWAGHPLTGPHTLALCVMGWSTVLVSMLAKSYPYTLQPWSSLRSKHQLHVKHVISLQPWTCSMLVYKSKILWCMRGGYLWINLTWGNGGYSICANVQPDGCGSRSVLRVFILFYFHVQMQ